MNRQNFKHIPDDVFDERVKRFMKSLRQMDEIYKTNKLKKIEADEVISFIDGIIDSFTDSFPYDATFPNKTLTKQLKAYEYSKYLYPKILTKTQIGELVGYKSDSVKSTHRHSMVIHNCQVIEDYIATKDKRWYDYITDIDSKIENVLL